VIDDPGHLSCGFTLLCCANLAEWIEVLLGVETVGYLRNIVLDFPHRLDAAFAKLLW